MRASSRLGCFSGLGVLAAFITTLVIAGYVYAQGGVLYSPGPLNAQNGEMLGGVTSHAETGGNCKACHTAPWESARMEDRCVVCHGNIAVQMKDVATLHGSLLTDQPDLRCRFCHPEHRGADASLTEMNGMAFPHEAVGFSLKGHQFKVAREAFVCSDCHTVDISTFDLQTCDTCHRQMDLGFMTGHVLSFGSACLDCHDGVDSLVTGLNHNNFAFKLRGKHEGVTCVKCHVDARTLVDFAEAPQDCFTCHFNDEPHEGRLGRDCALCHSVDGWTPAKFDHNLAAFKLEGKHASVACESCHRNNVFKGTPTDCYSCHRQDDEHNGQLGTDCAACHNPSDWENATFDHSRSNFPLTGAHVNVACERCHTGGQFKGLSTACVACHAEPAFHAGLFDTDCAACHNTAAWAPAQFNGPHAFPLNHGGGATCATCHPSGFTTYTCYGCHEHNETKIRSEHLEEGISNFQDCMRCHPTGQEHEGGEGAGDD
ncbi:MAG: cytochrome c3 family protein [Chloroflexi bacterium]|nr:cytochrome c3 family protein [Chloroflexota bacterium]